MKGFGPRGTAHRGQQPPPHFAEEDLPRGACSPVWALSGWTYTLRHLLPDVPERHVLETRGFLPPPGRLWVGIDRTGHCTVLI